MNPKASAWARRLALFLLVVSVVAGLTGCATRYRRHSVIDRRIAKVDLVSEVEGLWGKVPHDYEHPAIISQERLTHILNAIEIETPHPRGGLVRAPAFHPDIVAEAAAAISTAFAEATPDQELGVKLVRKEQKLGVFHTKYLTSCIAYMKDGYLYLMLSRVNWPIPQAKESEKLPEPLRDRVPMNFRVVSGDYLFYAGPRALEIAWQDPVFRAAYRLPGTTDGKERRRELLFETPIPKEERDATDNDGIAIDSLSSEQLRALADLEDDRREGRITESAYQRAKRQLLRPR